MSARAFSFTHNVLSQGPQIVIHGDVFMLVVDTNKAIVGAADTAGIIQIG